MLIFFQKLKFNQFVKFLLIKGISPTEYENPDWGGFRTIGAGLPTYEHIAWWTGGAFDGTRLAVLPWFAKGSDLYDLWTAVGEYDLGGGKVVVATAPGFVWSYRDGAMNTADAQANLETFTANAINYVIPKPSIAVVGAAADMSGLGVDEQAAYGWVMEEYGKEAVYLSFNEIAVNGIPDGITSIWFHHAATNELPAEAASAAATISAFMEAGGGVFLSDYANSYAVDLGLTTVGPSELIRNDEATTDGAWGLQPLADKMGHPIFQGIEMTNWDDPNWGGFRTVEAGLRTYEHIAWWTGGAFDGTRLGVLPWFAAGSDLYDNWTAIGEFNLGEGGAIVATAPGFVWSFREGDMNSGQPLANLQQFTKNVLEYVSLIGLTQSMKLVYEGDFIREGEEDGTVIGVEVVNATFNESINPDNVTITGMPAGISATIERTGDNTANITLMGTPDDYDVDIAGFKVTIPASEFVNLRSDELTAEADFFFRGIVEVEVVEGKVVLVGVFPTFTDLDADEQAAYNWAIEEFGADNVTYYDFQSLVEDYVANGEEIGGSLLDGVQVVWWHNDAFLDLPIEANNTFTEGMMQKFHAQGGSIFLSGFATQYVRNLGLEDNIDAMEIIQPVTEGNPDRWGYKTANPNHPAFTNLASDVDPNFFTLKTNGTRENSIAWWVINPTDERFIDIPVEDRFHGTQLASTEWDAGLNILVTVGEYESDGTTGSVFVIGAGAYDWHIPDGENELIGNVETLSFNVINYLTETSLMVGIEDVIAGQIPVIAYPNPFSDQINFTFNLTSTENIALDVYDVQGRLVANVVNSDFNAGLHTATWKAGDAPVGIYFYRLQIGDKVTHGQLSLQR